MIAHGVPDVPGGPAPRICSIRPSALIRDCNAGLDMLRWLARLFTCICDRRSSMVVTTEIPTLPPMLRARFIRPEAALFLSRGRYAYAAVLMGTKRNARPAD